MSVFLRRRRKGHPRSAVALTELLKHEVIRLGQTLSKGNSSSLKWWDDLQESSVRIVGLLSELSDAGPDIKEARDAFVGLSRGIVESIRLRTGMRM